MKNMRNLFLFILCFTSFCTSISAQKTIEPLPGEQGWTVNNPAQDFFIQGNTFAFSTHDMFVITYGTPDWRPIMENNIVID